MCMMQLKKILAMVSSIVVVGALTCCALLHFISDSKAGRMNAQWNLI